MQRRALVCGGAGFVGSHLCERLLLENYHVICIDNLLTGRKRNITHLFRHPHFEFRNHDVVDPIHLEVDHIYNLACPASPRHYQQDPVRTTKTSVMGAINLLELAERTGARILQASTSEVYGEPAVHPQHEDYPGYVNFIGPRGCYDEGKRCAETLFSDYRRQKRIDARVARIFNTYGPRMQLDDGRVVSNFIVQSLSNSEITVNGNGQQTRSFCYVDDMIDGLVALMTYPGKTPGPINLGNPTEVTVLDLAKRIIGLTASRSRVKLQPLPADDPTRRKPDIRRAREVLGWQPKVSLEQGLVATITAIQRELAGDAPKDVGRVTEVA